MSTVAPYLTSKQNMSKVTEEPAFEDAAEFQLLLPTTLSGPDLKIRIPPELMPDDETVMHYFDLYFTEVHPYVPVLNKPALYQQWRDGRDTISPFLLEAIFAIGSRLADDPSQGLQWLALASSVSCFPPCPCLTDHSQNMPTLSWISLG